MFCKNCGNQVPEGAKFCKKCGMKLKRDNGTNMEDHICGVNGDSEKENDKKSKKKKRSFGKIFFRVLLILILLIAIVIALDYYGILQFSFDEVKQNEVNRESVEAVVDDVLEDIQIEHPDADVYYEQNAELLATIEVTKSENVLTEKDAERTLTERGFSDYSIWSEYSMDGEYYGAQEIVGTVDKHPIYQTYYVTDNNEIWTIIVINGSVVANPVSFNMQSQLGVQVVFSETNVITSYDSVTNKFYESIPNESELIVYVVDKIDANTIDKLTVEVIEGYEQ